MLFPLSAPGAAALDLVSPPLRVADALPDRREHACPDCARAEDGAAGANLGCAHSMTSSARARIAGGTVRPSALAVLRLTTSSNMAGCCTGRSAGLAPARMRPT